MSARLPPVKVQPLADEHCSPQVKRMFRAVAPDGNVEPFYRVLAHKPAALRAYLQLSGALSANDSELSDKLKVLADIRVSICSGGAYCAAAYANAARRLGVSEVQIEALREPGGRRNQTLFNPVEQAVLRFTDLLTSNSGNIDDRDLDDLSEHFTETQIVELVLTIATANWTNRVTDGLRTPLP
jgi:uncharacterized peroxidase-related enzyme